MLAIHGLAESFPAGILPGVQKGYVVQFDRKILGTYTGQLLVTGQQTHLSDPTAKGDGVHLFKWTPLLAF